MESYDIINRIGILGAGTWGIALAKMLAESGKDVTVWSAIEKEIEDLKNACEHPKLKGIILPKNIKYTTSLEDVCKDKMIIVFAVPSVFIRDIASRVSHYIVDNQIIVNVAKGMESNTLMTLSEVILDEIKNDTIKIVVLSGPTHAEEVANQLPTTLVSASKELACAEIIQKYFTCSYMRIYTNTDVKGVEVSGTMKNIIALATGIAKGMGYGDNTKAALITRGLAEIIRLGDNMGCLPETFVGLTGIGDLIVTCTSEYSRNYQCGQLIGNNMPIDMAIKKVGMVVEGINALPAAVRLAEYYQVDMPIIMAVNDIVFRNKKPKEVVDILLSREQKLEKILI